MEVFCLRVHKNTAGKKFPFDRVYLIKYDDRDVIEQMFRYSIVLPIEAKLAKLLREIKVEEYVNRTFHRNDAEQAAAKIAERDWHTLLDSTEWVLVVPVLSKWMKQNMPRYLVAEDWYRTKSKQRRKKGVVAITVTTNESPFSHRSYVQTPERKIRPICVVCPRMIMHQNGECQLGDEICFTSLPLGVVNHFEEGEAFPDATPNMNELEEHHLIEDDVLETEPAPTSKARELLRIVHE